MSLHQQLAKALEDSKQRAAELSLRRTDTSVRFGTNDRVGALQYAVRMSSAEYRPYVLFYDYFGNDWMSMPYDQFVVDSPTRRDYLLATEDLRFILPKGEILHW